MSTPMVVEWNVGKDIHGRRVRLRQSLDYAGKVGFSIISEPVSQRDEGEKIDNLSRENLVAIADAVGRGSYDGGAR